MEGNKTGEDRNVLAYLVTYLNNYYIHANLPSVTRWKRGLSN